jgi:hypothetical protein
MTRSRGIASGGIVAVAALLSSCASSGGDAGGPPPTSPAVEAAADSVSKPSDLVGMWRLTGVEGVGEQAWLRVAADGFTLVDGCGTVSGTWAAASSAFVASVSSGSPCDVDDGGDIVDQPWLASAVTYVVDDERAELLDGDGQVVAALHDDGSAPPPGTSSNDDHSTVPELTPAQREVLDAPTTLPADLSPVSGDALVGRWSPVGEKFATDPNVSFRTDGTWRATDGCNGLGGRWSVADSGLLVISSTMVLTLVGCEGSHVPIQAQSARRAGFDGEVLVLLDATGTELGRFDRE